MASVARISKKLASPLQKRLPFSRQPKAVTPAGMIPEVRRPDFGFSANLPKWWGGGNPVKTLLAGTLSAGFPPGERFFIDSVRHYQAQIKDPELLKAIRGFIGQEAHHSKEHKGLNDYLQSRGIGLDRLEREIEGFMSTLRKMSPERQLAHTVAVEHFPALMAEGFLLKYEDALTEMDPRMAKLWAWHAIEESEHKAVAFDVYKAIGGSEFNRITQYLQVSIMFPFFTSVHVLRLMNQAGELGNLKAWAEGLNYFFGTAPGVFRKLLPDYLAFFSLGLHPWQKDSRAQVAEAKLKWLGYTADAKA